MMAFRLSRLMAANGQAEPCLYFLPYYAEYNAQKSLNRGIPYRRNFSAVSD